MQRTLPKVLLLAAVASALPFSLCHAQAAEPAGNHHGANKIPLVQAPLPASAISVPGGFVGTRWRANISGSLKGFDIDGHVCMVEERKMRDWFYIGPSPCVRVHSARHDGAFGMDESA